MIVKNEEKHLKRCLDSVKNLVDEMIVIDTGSQDRTQEIAREAGAEVYTYIWKNDFADARNYSLSLSRADWNFILDADEYVSSGSKEDILSFLESGSCLGDIQRRDVYIENGEKTYCRSRISRILPRGVFYKGRIHEQPDSQLPTVLLPIIIEHDGYLQTGEKEKRNLPYLLRELKERPRDSYLLYKIAGSQQILGEGDKALDTFRKFYQEVPPQAPYRPKGVVGYLYSLMDSKNYTEALKIIQHEKENLKNYASYHFFCGVFYMHLVLADTAAYINYLPEIEQSYLRCLEIGTDTRDEEDIGAGTYKAAYNLGTWYEVNGNLKKAIKYYREAADEGYEKAQDRLELIKQTLPSG